MKKETEIKIQTLTSDHKSKVREIPIFTEMTCKRYFVVVFRRATWYPSGTNQEQQ
jgi:hypothetical protein